MKLKEGQAHIHWGMDSLKFKFRDEVHSLDLREGDRGDYWNAITTKYGVVFDVNLYVEEANYLFWKSMLSDDNKDYDIGLTLYPVVESEFGEMTDTGSPIDIEIVSQVGKISKYLNK